MNNLQENEDIIHDYKWTATKTLYGWQFNGFSLKHGYKLSASAPPSKKLENYVSKLNSSDKVSTGVSVFICHDNKLLMGKRKGAAGEGTWSVPGGWVSKSDMTLFDTAHREVFEETDLKIVNLQIAGTALTRADNIPSVTVFVTANCAYSAPLKTKEPDKLDGEWKWFDLDSLPSPLFEPINDKEFLFSLRNKR